MIKSNDIQGQIAAMKIIKSRVHALCDKAGTEGMSDADYREVDELRHFVSEHCQIPPIDKFDLLLKEHRQLFFEIGADYEKPIVGKTEPSLSKLMCDEAGRKLDETLERFKYYNDGSPEDILDMLNDLGTATDEP